MSLLKAEIAKPRLLICNGQEVQWCDSILYSVFIYLPIWFKAGLRGGHFTLLQNQMKMCGSREVWNCSPSMCGFRGMCIAK